MKPQMALFGLMDPLLLLHLLLMGRQYPVVKGEEWVAEIFSSPSWILEFIESPAGRYWITFDGNVSYFDGNTWVSAPRPAPFAGDDLRFFEDGNGDLWVTGNGIYKWQETEKMVRENG